MRVFADVEEMRDAFAGIRKWARAAEAVSLAPGLARGASFSIGDSLTYRVDTATALSTGPLVGRRRYHLAVAALEGDIEAEVAAKADSRVVEAYSDLTDREEFDGPARRLRVPQGAMLVVDIDEAARILPGGSVGVLLHVSVEGATFHNK